MKNKKELMETISRNFEDGEVILRCEYEESPDKAQAKSGEPLSAQDADDCQ